MHELFNFPTSNYPIQNTDYSCHSFYLGRKNEAFYLIFRQSFKNKLCSTFVELKLCSTFVEEQR